MTRHYCIQSVKPKEYQAPHSRFECSRCGRMLIDGEDLPVCYESEPTTLENSGVVFKEPVITPGTDVPVKPVPSRLEIAAILLPGIISSDKFKDFPDATESISHMAIKLADTLIAKEKETRK